MANHFSIVGLAAAPALGAVATGSSPGVVACSHVTGQGSCSSTGPNTLQLSVPSGATACPNSGQGVACGSSDADRADAGVASTPDGSTACTTSQNPAGVAACGDLVLQVPASAGSKGGSASAPVVEPSVPDPMAQPAPVHGLILSIDHNTAMPGHSLVLTATADAPVTGTGNAIEIFDLTAGKQVGMCLQGSQCSVAYAANSGVHSFTAFVSSPTSTVPAGSTVITSNAVQASWIAVTFSATSKAVGPGQSVTITASSTIPVDKTGWLLQIYDAPAHSRLTYCASGNTCSTTLSQPNGGWRTFVAVISAPSTEAPPADKVVAQTDTFTVTWLSAAVYAVSNSGSAGGVVHVVATANTDLTHTPWSMGIFDDHGQLVAPVCKNGSTCTADLTITDRLPSFSAAIGLVPNANGGTLGQLLKKVTGPAKLVNIQAQSPLIKPSIHTSRMMWGVDSCKSFTDDPGGGTGLYPMVASRLGTPDFWGRYLTPTICPAISSAEISAAHNHNMGILPIYDDFNCSNVSGYDTGHQYGLEAVAAAQNLGIPKGVGLVIDIEPPGDACPGAANVDGGFVTGWYDAVASATYVPVYYGNGGPGTEFATAYCAAVTARPEIANNSHIWTYEASLWGNYSKANLPGWDMAYNTHCPEHGTAWQFMLSAGSDPDVDQDRLISDLPLWFP